MKTAKKRWREAHRAARILYSRGASWFDVNVCAWIGKRPVTWRFGQAWLLGFAGRNPWLDADDAAIHRARTLSALKAGDRTMALYWARLGLSHIRPVGVLP